MWTEKWPQKRSCASPPRSSSSIPPKFTTKRWRAFAIGPPPVEPSSALNLLAIAGTEYGLIAALIWGRDHRRDHRSRNAAHAFSAVSTALSDADNQGRQARPDDPPLPPLPLSSARHLRRPQDRRGISLLAAAA